jgi:spermidine synthase
MTTEKQEHESMELALKECPENARVFIGGLGLGLILLKLAQSKKAREVLVAEREQRVISVVEPIIRRWFKVHYPDFNWKVICGDALEEVGKHGKWDWIFFDIWSNAYSAQKDEPTPEDVKTKAKPFLTERGRLTIWTMVVKEMRESKISPEVRAKVDRLFSMVKKS